MIIDLLLIYMHFEKKKYGAKLEKIHAFIKVDETYNLDIIATLS